MTALRVYDSDIHGAAEEPLRNLAASIALTYAGNWDAMIAWKRHCSQAQPLGTQDIRTILNMALSDVTQSAWHAEIRPYLLRFMRPEPPAVERAPRPLRLVPDPPKRKWFVKLKARLRSDVFKPAHPMGKVHLVDHGRTVVEWSIKHQPGCTEDDPKIPHLIVWGWCGKRYDNVLIPTEIVTEDSSQICAGCRRQKAEVGKQPSDVRTCYP